MIQLELFEETELERQSRKIEMLERSLDRMRKSQYALLGEIRRIADENRHELQTLKHVMCRNKINLWD